MASGIFPQSPFPGGKSGWDNSWYDIVLASGHNVFFLAGYLATFAGLKRNWEKIHCPHANQLTLVVDAMILMVSSSFFCTGFQQPISKDDR